VTGSPELCAARGKQYLRYADILWMETPSPSLQLADKFSKIIKKSYPEKMLAYNLSPSFNWSAFGMNDSQIESFCSDLGKLGYVFQFITLGGFHLNALKSEKLARDFSKRAMLAYVEKVQRKEEKHKID
jgi:isocitrate lyase